MGPENNNQLSREIKRLMFLFGFVYFAQGVAQASGLISQPLALYLKEVLGFAADKSATYLAVLTIPWVIKPLYGLISDFVPLLGYRRKTWLVLMNGMAALAFLWLTGLTDATTIRLAMLLTCIGTAASDVIIDALMVENGQKYNATARFQSVQWFWFYVSAIATSLIGGYLCEWLSPESALRVAALVTMFAPAAVVVLGWIFIKEEKARINAAQLRDTRNGLLEAVKSRLLWAVALFLAFWNFSPSFGTPLFYHMMDTLHFSQKFIGQLSAVGAVGSVIGAWAYGYYFSKKTLRFQLLFSIITGTIGTIAYLLLVAPSPYAMAIAITLSLVFGASGMVAVLTTMTLAAQVCPKKAEGFTFSALMSVNNGFAQLSAIFGAWLFVNVFGNSLTPLIWVSAGFTFACLALMPIISGVRAAPDDADKSDKN